jgi:hypothetical protein
MQGVFRGVRRRPLNLHPPAAAAVKESVRGVDERLREFGEE